MASPSTWWFWLFSCLPNMIVQLCISVLRNFIIQFNSILNKLDCTVFRSIHTNLIKEGGLFHLIKEGGLFQLLKCTSKSLCSHEPWYKRCTQFKIILVYSTKTQLKIEIQCMSQEEFMLKVAYLIVKNDISDMRWNTAK